MVLTYRQKDHLRILGYCAAAAVVIAGLIVGLIFLVGAMDQQMAAPAVQQPPPPPQVNSRDYVQVNTANDGTVDRYCVGSDGYYFSQNIETMTVTANDPACK